MIAKWSRKRDSIRALEEWRGRSERIDQICLDLGIPRKKLKDLVEEHGYRPVSAGQFNRFINGKRRPPDFNSLVIACASAFAKCDLRELPDEIKVHDYATRIHGDRNAHTSQVSFEGLTLHHTRLEFWDANIETIIRACEKLVLVDSFLGYKQTFWSALEERVAQGGSFQLVYLILRKGDPFLTYNLKLVGAPAEITSVDIACIERLKSALQNSRHKANKKLEFFYWEGLSPGPILAWTINGTEKIGLGLWLNFKGITDDAPYLVISEGPLFDAVRKHYTALCEGARNSQAVVV